MLAKLTSEPRTLRKPEKQNKREDAALRERANGKGRNHHDKLAANQQITPNDAPDSVSERRDRASATQHPIDGKRGRPAGRAAEGEARPHHSGQRAGLRLTKLRKANINAAAGARPLRRPH
jgi:hypothetical protein